MQAKKSRRINTAALGMAVASSLAVAAVDATPAGAYARVYYRGGLCCGNPHNDVNSRYSMRSNNVARGFTYPGGESKTCVQEYVSRLGHSDYATCQTYGNLPHDHLTGGGFDDARCYQASYFRSPWSCGEAWVG